MLYNRLLGWIFFLATKIDKSKMGDMEWKCSSHITFFASVYFSSKKSLNITLIKYHWMNNLPRPHEHHHQPNPCENEAYNRDGESKAHPFSITDWGLVSQIVVTVKSEIQIINIACYCLTCHHDIVTVILHFILSVTTAHHHQPNPGKKIRHTNEMGRAKPIHLI